MGNTNLFYRMRSLDRLLGKEWRENGGKDGELDKQEIYFASPNELNDPMEGFCNIIFKEDKNVWHNLFKHYVLCLYATCDVCYSYDKLGKKLNDNCILLDIIVDKTLNQKHKKIFNSIYNDFYEYHKKDIDTISKTNITKNELIVFFYYIHTMALRYINHYSSKNYCEDIIKTTTNKQLKKITKKFLSYIKTSKKKIPLCNMTLEQWYLSYEQFDDLCFYGGSSISAISKNQRMITNFPYLYMDYLEQIILPKCCVASFMKKAHNSSLWGHYADGHKGVCLIFKSSKNKIILSNNKLSFKKINYNAKFSTINFFKNTDIFKQGINLEQTISINNQKQTINTIRSILTKTNDWSYEKEYRLIYVGSKRILKYDFCNLYGIIFGINTPIDAKHKIIKIIRQKCQQNNRSEFNFFQAYYHKNSIQYKPLFKKLQNKIF